MSTRSQTRLVLIRHGAIDARWRGRVYGDLDVPLSPEGREEARRAAEVLAGVRLAAVVSSGLARAEFGAALMREPRGLERRDEPAFREIGRGAWRGKTFEEVGEDAWRSWLRAPSVSRPEGGESLEDLGRRVLPGLDGLVGELSGRTFALVAHTWVVRVIVCEVLRLPLDAAPRLTVPTGSITLVDWTQEASGHRRAPTLAGFAVDRTPDRGRGWNRSPRRG